MEERDLSFKANFGRFNYRVGAIIICGGRLLMVKNSNSPYYYTVGGRVKFGESSEDAVLREVFEETGMNFEIDRLAYIHENFFVYEVENEPFHEISFFYLMKSRDEKDMENLACTSIGEDGGEESLHWLPIDEIEKFHAYPEFFKTELVNMQVSIAHFITREGEL